ncbi:MAG: acetylxylan esterase [Armatimonadetes bacterium]|nr:acetylxylan esterase [Armatimonadota bacterium]
MGVSPNPPFYTDHAKLMVYKDASGQERPVKTKADWQKRREHILANMQLVMGPLPASSRKTPLDMQVLEEERLPAYTRQKITFAVEKGDRVPAYLLVPHDLKGKNPAVLCLHQTIEIGKAEPAGLGGSPNLHYAAHLAERGYIALAPDYPSGYMKFGDYAADPYGQGYASATMKGIWNHMRAVDLLQSLPEVDDNRIGCIGHSLGGHNTMFLAAFDTRIKALVSSCGFTAFPKYMNGDLTGWSHKGYMPRIATEYGCDPQKMPFDFPEIVAALAPRAFFANAPTHDDNFEPSGVDDCIAAALPVYELLGGKGKLKAIHPESQHDFPEAARQEAYAFLDRWLKK